MDPAERVRELEVTVQRYKSHVREQATKIVDLEARLVDVEARNEYLQQSRAALQQRIVTHEQGENHAGGDAPEAAGEVDAMRPVGQSRYQAGGQVDSKKERSASQVPQGEGQMSQKVGFTLTNALSSSLNVLLETPLVRLRCWSVYSSSRGSIQR